jgi:trans-aconitate methyltransferase
VSDTDSALGLSFVSTSTTSLASSILNYQYENGRRYHAYRAGAYVLPNDELEQDRLDLRHHIFRLTLDGRLFRAPLSTVPERVLDIGTGTGIWAIEFADEFPSALVVGTDLSPIQPHWVPPNCKFVIDDAESDWLYAPDEAFDYIHGRGLGGSIADWARFYRQVYANLKPGGWIEMQEYEAWVKSDDDTIYQTGKWVSEWQQRMDEASIKFGKRLNVAEMQKQYLIDAGFVDVQDDIYKVCVGSVDQLIPFRRACRN